MAYEEFISFLQDVGKDPSRLIFEDELTGIHNRRFLLNYFEYKVRWDALDNHPWSSFGPASGDAARRGSLDESADLPE